ncbi:GDSL esterase/lipase [Vitis vinifera]|uniref:GDSL esterase/lipase n=1 Tax=Vitis vinifera TaxID=29760 RepID=A0A438EFX1_VITVI|nr:GDSL esterase/lipase [Vitis vinifera]
MESVKLFWLFGLLIIGSAGECMGVMGGHGPRRCSFPAIFNFGDSNSDTGGRSAAISEVFLPNGETFFGKASGRFCDGRLILDFISTKAPFKSKVPRPRDFSKALYTIDIGQNDLAYGFQHTNEEKVLASIPDILNCCLEYNYMRKVERTFWIHNTGPIGCLPYSVIYYQQKPRNLDRYGCVKPHNKVAQEFNKQLKDMVIKLRAQLPHAEFTYVDVYSVKYSLVSQAKDLGFVDLMNFCCGNYYGYHVECGQKAVVNGTVYGIPCEHPSRHISWDGTHYSEAANEWVAKAILNGSFSDPPIPVSEACHQ